MGISKLGKFVDETCNIRTVSLPQIFASPCEVAIDSSIFLYRFIHNSRSDADYILNIIKFVIKLKELVLEPIFVIDGKSGKEKSNTQNKRRQQRQNIKDKIVLLQNKMHKTETDEQEIQKLEKKASTITRHHIELFKKTLTMLGITYFHCKGEADPMCAALVKQGIAKFCLTNDNDMLAHGCNVTCQNFRFANNQVSVYDLDSILNKLDITYDQFVDMCIMLGTDYNRPIFGITAGIAYDCVKQYENIENILNSIDEINNTIVKHHRELIKNTEIKIKNLKRPDRKCKESFNYQHVRNMFKNDINIKEYIQSTNLYDFTHEWMHSNERLMKLEQFLQNMVNMNSQEARQKVQRINIIWSSVCYKRNTYMSQYCVSEQSIKLVRRFHANQF